MKENSNFIEMHGIVTKILGGNYTIKLTNNLDIDGYVSGKMRIHNIRVYEKDIVRTQLSPYDLYKGRIVFRLNPKRDNLPDKVISLCQKLNIKLPVKEEIKEQ